MSTMKAFVIFLIGFAAYATLCVFINQRAADANEEWACVEGLAYVKQHGVLVHVEGIADNVRHPKRWVECLEVPK